MSTDAAPRRRRNHGLWLGPLLVFGGAVSYFTFFARFPVLRDFPWVNLPVVTLGLFLSALASWRAFARPRIFRGKILGSLGLVVSLALTVLFNLYVFVFSYWLPEASAASLALDRAPPFALLDHQERRFDLGDLSGKKVVIVFYRGFW